MADSTGLGILGLAFGGVTAAVLLIAFCVVAGHVDGRLAFDEGPQTVASAVAKSGS